MKIATSSPILLIGGLAMKADEHEPLANNLYSNLGRRILYFDNINVGDGPRVEAPKQLTILDQAIHQWKKIDKIIGKTTSISIYGISMGGMIASTMATLYPQRVNKLVLAATSANLQHNPSVSDEMFENWINAKHEDDIKAATKIAFGSTTLQTKPQIFEEYFQYRLHRQNKQKAKEFIQQLISISTFDGKRIYRELNLLNVNATVLAGKEDRLFNNSHLSDIKQLLPNAYIVEFEATGHMLHLENLDYLTKTLTTGDCI